MLRRAGIALLLTLSLAACGGSSGGAKSDAPYNPSDSARSSYESDVESDLGPQFMGSVSDHDGFQSSMEEAGDVACTRALAGQSRDSWQTYFRTAAGGTVNGARESDEQLDQVSMDIWAEALKDLCPAAGS